MSDTHREELDAALLSFCDRHREREPVQQWRMTDLPACYAAAHADTEDQRGEELEAMAESDR